MVISRTEVKYGETKDDFANYTLNFSTREKIFIAFAFVNGRQFYTGHLRAIIAFFTVRGQKHTILIQPQILR